MAKSKKAHSTGSKQHDTNRESTTSPAGDASNGLEDGPISGYASDITESGIQSKVQKVLQNALPAATNKASGVHQVILESDIESTGSQIQAIAASSPIAQKEASVFKPIEVPSPVTPIEQGETGSQKALKRWTPPPKRVTPPPDAEPFVSAPPVSAQEPAPVLTPSSTSTSVSTPVSAPDTQQSAEFTGTSIASAEFQYEIDRYSPATRLPNRKPGMTQEFDISKLVAHTREIAIEAGNQQSDELSSAMMYFAGHAGKTTYTAELRFRAQCAAERNNELDSSINDAQQIAAEEQQWNQLDNFAPPSEESPRILPSSGLNMLDVIDQSYKTILTGPESFAPPRQVEVEVDYSQSQSRLLPPQNGLKSGLGNSTKSGGSAFKNRWSKR